MRNYIYIKVYSRFNTDECASNLILDLPIATFVGCMCPQISEHTETYTTLLKHIPLSVNKAEGRNVGTSVIRPFKK